MHRHRNTLPIRTSGAFVQMSDSESRSAGSGNAFSGEELSSTDSSRSCSSGTEAVRIESLYQTVMQGVTTGEDIEPLSMIKEGRFYPGSGSGRVPDVTPPQAEGGEAEVEGEEVDIEVEVEDEPVPEEVEVAEGVPVAYRIDRVPLSMSTEDDLLALRRAFDIPGSVTMRLPEKGELRSASSVPGETLVHPFFFGEGLRIPLPAFQQRFLAEVGLSIAQLNPNTWRCLNALYTLYHHCGFGEPDLAVFFSQWVLEEHSKADKGWYKAKTVLKARGECPRDTEWMEVESRGHIVSRCCLAKEALTREGMAGQFDIEAHEIGSPDIIRDPLVFGNPTSQQTWKNRYFFVGGRWEFPEGSEPPVKRVPCSFREASGC